jgi:CheY-like chemotaxis protein
MPGLHVFPMCTLQERSNVERDLPEGFARLLTRPVKRDHLRSALALSIGVLLDEQRSQGRGLSSEALSARARYRILVAEDYALNRKLALRMLTRAGYACEVVDDGRKVLEAVARQRYDMILMDCQMPEVDGFTATRQIRRLEAIEGGHVPIVAMTANAMKGDRERCIQAGMDDYLSKPIQVEALYALLTRYLPDSPTPAAPPAPETPSGA